MEPKNEPTPPNGDAPQAADESGTLTLQMSPASADGVEVVPVHRFSVAPMYGHRWPVSIVLAQYALGRLPTRAIEIRAEKDTLRAFTTSASDRFLASLERNAQDGPTGLQLTATELDTLSRLEPSRWVHLAMVAAQTATAFNGAEAAWYEASTIAVHGSIERKLPILSTPRLRTPMTASCLLELTRACIAYVESQRGDTGPVPRE